jgi:antirestriction protein
MLDTPRIYVACLASYNAGIHHGEWIDADDVDEAWETVAAVLRRSPCPNVQVDCPEEDCTTCPNCEESLQPLLHGEYGCASCGGMFEKSSICTTCKGEEKVPSAESPEIFDHEGFGSYEPGGIEDACRAGELVREFGEVFHAASRHFVGLDEIERACREQYRGQHKSLAMYYADQEEEFGTLQNIPEHLQYYIDWESYARDQWGCVLVRNPQDCDANFVFDTEA